MSIPALNQIQRDAVQRLLPAFRTSGYKGGGDPDMLTEHLKPGAYLEKKMKGYTVPTFDELLQGLKFIPAGQDARGLTQCLAWYLEVRDMFQPKLELNVLHSQALFRALRQPLKPLNTQNPNRYALERCNREGTLLAIGDTKVRCGGGREGPDDHGAANSASERAVIKIRKDSIDLKAQVCIPLRNLLTFPFLALHGVVSEAFKMGIEKAEQRRAVRKDMAIPTKQRTANAVKDEQAPQRTPKRPRKAEAGEIETPVQTPKRQRVIVQGSSMLQVQTPRRPTVSPITPRTSTQSLGNTNSHDSVAKLEFGLRQRGPARPRPC